MYIHIADIEMYMMQTRGGNHQPLCNRDVDSSGGGGDGGGGGGVRGVYVCTHEIDTQKENVDPREQNFVSCRSLMTLTVKVYPGHCRGTP